MTHIMNIMRYTVRIALALAILLGVSGVSHAITYDLKADVVTKVMPDGQEIVMWGFGHLADAEVSVPGPILSVPPGDTILTINLTNNLAVPISIVIPGQQLLPVPAKFVDVQGRLRARSFTYETAPGATVTYTWNNPRTGTYLYHSGTHPAVQVQMGLYGAVIHDVAAGEAYAGQLHDNEALLLFSEIDPKLHSAVVDGSYGTPVYPSTIDYLPKYFMINGSPYTGNPLDPGAEAILDHPVLSTETTLIRLLNAGLKSHAPTFENLRLNVIAEDGNLYPYPKDGPTVFMPASKTLDLILSPTSAGTYQIFDRRLHLNNGQAMAGGMMINLTVDAPVAVDDAFVTDEDIDLVVPAPGVLDNDTGAGTLISLLVHNAAHGAVTLMDDGSFMYEPEQDFNGVDSFTYRASNGILSNLATVEITINPVNDPPVARHDVAISRGGRSVNIPVLANDYDVDSDINAASIAITHPSVRGATVTPNPNGTITYTPRPRFRGLDYFWYTVQDVEGAVSNQARVLVRVLR